MVSIHAPVKGATGPLPWDEGMGPVSIHAPVKGATLRAYVQQHRGHVSIHAPVKGATRVHTGRRPWTMGFNPRTREGCDSGRAKGQNGIGGFNPRTREGCDYVQWPAMIWEAGFNPRTREGCDCGSWSHRLLVGVSIHAPVKGATKSATNWAWRPKFQSTHP